MRRAKANEASQWGDDEGEIQELEGRASELERRSREAQPKLLKGQD